MSEDSRAKAQREFQYTNAYLRAAYRLRQIGTDEASKQADTLELLARSPEFRERLVELIKANDEKSQ
jgi:hypothetical protein